MGWTFPWYTMTDEWDKDFGVDQWHGTNAFIRDGDRVFRTYFLNNRGDEALGSTWSYLDMSALGRQEEWEDSPEGYPQTPPYKMVARARRIRNRPRRLSREGLDEVGYQAAAKVRSDQGIGVKRPWRRTPAVAPTLKGPTVVPC